MDFSKRTITVQGTKVEFNTRTHFPVGDLSADMGDVASAMAWWGSVWAAAAAEAIDADAYYRAWRAQTSEKFLAEDGKLSVDKLKNKVEGHPDFLKCKKALALAEENVTLSKACFNALEKKGNMLQSLGAKTRAELGATGMSTPAEPKSAPRVKAPVEDDDDEPDDAPTADPGKIAAADAKMRGLNKGKSNKVRFAEKE